MDTEIVETRIPTRELKLGMHVVRLDRSWLETDFPLQGFILTCRDDIEALQQQCDYVYIEGRKAHAAANWTAAKGKYKNKGKEKSKGKAKPGYRAPSPRSPGQTAITYINKIGVEAELAPAANGLRRARHLARDIITGVRLGAVIDANRCRHVVSDIVDSVLRNNHALLCLTQIKNKDDYTAEHSLNVCILAATFARHLGLDRDEIERLALCGLLHDVGKIRVRDEILNKEGAFTPPEFEEMKLHPVHGRDILMSVANLDGIVVDVAYSHHERPSGQGYPRKLRSEQIPYYAKIISVVDAYDAITSNRCHDRARSSKTALDILYRCRGEQFDEQLALSFIQCIGIYPPGSIVEMTNGEVGIVLRAHPTQRLKPRVLLIRDRQKGPSQERIADLSQRDLDADGKPYAIARELPNHSHGIDLEMYLANGLILSSMPSTGTV